MHVTFAELAGGGCQLVGELYRRIGNIREADAWFLHVPEKIRDPKAQGWIFRVAIQQRNRPREWFG